ncbi:MAG: Do family serine endopeptidase [Hyphomicrobiaceae bacterium]
MRSHARPHTGHSWSVRTRISAMAFVAAATAAFAADIPQAFAQRSFVPPPSLAPLADKLSDAVVNISTTQAQKGPQGVPLPKVPKGSPFEEFFDDFFQKRGGKAPPDRKISSLGSGFVIDPEGLIATNNHVIDGADEIIINFHDGTKLKVEKVIGRDTKTDIALLKVNPKKPLKAVPLGSSAKMMVGDWVLAIGNPFGLGGSVSLGIISAKQRDINSGPYDDYLQTDAAINKGNSGGPLFNMEGEVIGINTAIISPTGGSIGIGFSVPSDTVASIVDQLKKYGEIRRGWLGVKIQTVTEDIAESLGIAENTGALVGGVSPDGPAAAGGIEAGDVILKFDGKDISTMRGLPRIVSQTPVGQSVDVELLRGGKKKTVKVTVGRLVDDDDKVDAGAKTPKSENGKKTDITSLIGLKVAVLSDELRAKFGLDAKMKGVVVVEIDPQSAAAQKSIKVGDVIVEAAQDPVATPDDIVRNIDKVKKAGKKAVLLRVEDGKGDTRFVAVPVS